MRVTRAWTLTDKFRGVFCLLRFAQRTRDRRWRRMRCFETFDVADGME